MTTEKKQVIVMHIDEMNIERNNKKLLLDAIQEVNPSKNCEKVIESAYKIALLIETQALSPKRERQLNANLSNACEAYNNELQLFIDCSR